MKVLSFVVACFAACCIAEAQNAAKNNKHSLAFGDSKCPFFCRDPFFFFLSQRPRNKCSVTGTHSGIHIKVRNC